MSKASYEIPEKIVNDEVAKMFIQDGIFNKAAFDRIDTNQKLTMQKSTKEELTAQKYSQNISKLYNPSASGEFISNMAKELRSFDLVSFSTANYPEAEVIKFGEENAAFFNTVNLSIITIKSSEREANQILNLIKNESITFEDAARAHSQDMYADRGGEMGSKMLYELLLDIPDQNTRDKTLELSQDELSEVFKTDQGWIIVRANSDVQVPDFNESSTIDRVRTYITEYQKGRMEDWAEEKANEFITLINEKGFEAALLSENLVKSSFGPVPINYGNSDLYSALSSFSIPELSYSSSDVNFWETAFSTPINEPSKPLVQGNNIIVLFPTSTAAADDETLAGIKNNYNSDWFLNSIQQSYQLHFQNSSKFKDQFYDTFGRLYQGYN
jgi:parvulin-like peptidyl-prolyl isomerase